MQADLELALTTVLRHDVDLTVAGRTDAGVHASGQVAHLDLPGALWAEHAPGCCAGCAARCRPDITRDRGRAAPAGFDARFAALAGTTPTGSPTRVPGRPRCAGGTPSAGPAARRAAMRVAAALLLGQHDFAAFCRRREGATTIRVLQALDVARDGDLVTVSASADAFCHSMVRSLVGALLAVGEGRRGRLAGLAARPHQPVRRGARGPGAGLTLLAVDYPPDDQLAARTQVTRARRDA